MLPEVCWHLRRMTVSIGWNSRKNHIDPTTVDPHESSLKGSRSDVRLSVAVHHLEDAYAGPP